MALPKFDDWKRPWKDEEFDAETAAKLIYNLHKDKEKLTESKDAVVTERDEALAAKKAAETKAAALEDKDLPEIERLRKENERLKTDPPAPATKGKDEASDLRAERAEIALEKGLTLAQAKRLVGKDRAELEADADAYIEEHNLGSAEGKTGGKGGQAPPSNRVKVTTGSKQRAQDNVGDDDDIEDPGAYYDKIHGKG